MFAQAIDSILDHHCTPAAVRSIEGGASAQPLASALADAGFLELLAPEDQGGGGAGWRDFFEVVLLCGGYAVPLPVAQTMAARLLTADPQALPVGFITFAPALALGADGSLEASQVPCAATASHVVGVANGELMLLPIAGAHFEHGAIHGGLSGSLRWQADAGTLLKGGIATAAYFPYLGALLQAGLLAGAMKRCFDLTLGYSNERIQFGKPIGKFQAIQHQLSVMAEHVAAARMASEAAFGTDALPTLPACAVAKARTSEAAQLVASIAHAVHGAIGVTEEYDLQLYTRRLHEGRLAHGSEAHWHRLLGRLFLDSPQPLAVDFIRTLWAPEV